ncbi:copper homeostasis protein CutC, partial [Bacteroides ovatus]
ARKLGADGVVFGCLTAEGEVDLPAMQKLMEAAQGLSVTIHRAFDVCRNPQRALEQIIKLGCNRILTSGQQPTAEQGIPLLKESQKQAAGRIMLLAGCGVNENNIARIAAETGINEFHFSARESIQSEMIFKNEAVSMGGTVHINEYERNVTSIRRVKETIDAALHG